MPDSLLITHGNTFTLGQRNEQIPDGAIYVEGDTIVEVGPTASLAAKYPGAAAPGCRREDRPARLHLRPHAFLWRVRPRHGDPRRAGHQLHGNPGATLVEARPGAAVG